MLNYSWSQDYSVDDPVIDDHHKNLLKLFNDAYSLLVNDEPITETIKLLHELKMYTVFHFSEEEKRMLANNYDGYEKHKEMHEAFIAKVSDLLQKVDVDPRVLNEDIFIFLNSWLIEHIQKVDKLYKGKI